jgi:DNA ligase (NAD+)
VGRTGLLTPVAILEPVNINGVMIERASLHNEGEINRLNVSMNDLVIVERCGDVIPKITGVSLMNDEDHHTLLPTLDKIRSFQRGDFRLPSLCPNCGSPTAREEGGAVVRCTGAYSCSAQVIEKIRYIYFTICFVFI